MKREPSPEPPPLPRGSNGSPEPGGSIDPYDDAELTGRVLDERYRIERKLGEGAMGVVFRAIHLGLGERVAIKFIRQDMRTDSDIRDRFAREARICMRIQSEHVVKVLDVSDVEPFGPYMVMEYVEGSTMNDLLADATGGCLPLSRVLDYMLQVCEGLAVAHGQGVVHNDIKPENLIVAWQGERRLVKILDFGVARIPRPSITHLPAEKTAVRRWTAGTPAYMAPERILGKSADPVSDLWSMGTLLFELVTGLPAYAGDDPVAIGQRVVGEKAPRLPHVGGLSEADHAALSEVVARCLRRDPGKRYEDLAELAWALAPLGGLNERAAAERIASIAGRVGLDAAAFGARRRPSWPGSDSALSVDRSAIVAVAPRATARPRRRAWPVWTGLLIMVGGGAAYCARETTGGSVGGTARETGANKPSHSGRASPPQSAPRARPTSVSQPAALSPLPESPHSGRREPPKVSLQATHGGELSASAQEKNTNGAGEKARVERLEPGASTGAPVLKEPPRQQRRRPSRMRRVRQTRTQAILPTKSPATPVELKPAAAAQRQRAPLLLVPSDDKPTLPLVPTSDEMEGTTQ